MHWGMTPLHNRSGSHTSVRAVSFASAYPAVHVYVALLGYLMPLVAVCMACSTTGGLGHGSPRHTPSLAPPQPTR